MYNNYFNNQTILPNIKKIPVYFEQYINGRWVYKEHSTDLIWGFECRVGGEKTEQMDLKVSLLDRIIRIEKNKNLADEEL